MLRVIKLRATILKGIMLRAKKLRTITLKATAMLKPQRRSNLNLKKVKLLY